MTESSPTPVFIAAEFKRNARVLQKRYRTIESDLQPLIQQLQNGELPGDRISGFPDYIVYKVRVKNSLLLRLYAKSDQDDVTTDEIQAIIQKFQADPNSP
jgi:hypothetical protein